MGLSWLSPHIFFSELARSWCPQWEAGTQLCCLHAFAPRREAPLTSTYHPLQGSVTSCSGFHIAAGLFSCCTIINLSQSPPFQIPARAGHAAVRTPRLVQRGRPLLACLRAPRCHALNCTKDEFSKGTSRSGSSHGACLLLLAQGPADARSCKHIHVGIRAHLTGEKPAVAARMLLPGAGKEQGQAG